MRRIISFILASVLAIHSAGVAAQYVVGPWPEEDPEIISAILSRTGITVRDINESLKLYRGILGMQPFYERVGLDDPRLPAYSGMTTNQQMRLVVLRIRTKGDAKINAGYLGLTEISEKDGTITKLPQEHSTGAAYGSLSLMFVVDDVLAIYEKVKAGGYEIISAPDKRENGKISQLLMRGPDGERLWITQGELVAPFIQKKK